MTDILIPTEKKHVVMDSQILSTLMSCERLTDFRFNQNLQPIGGKGNALEAGWLMHQYLEVYYKSIRDGIRGQDAIDAALVHGEACIKNGMDGSGLTNTPVLNEKHGNGALDRIGTSWIIDTFLQYCEHYKNDSITPLDIEKVMGKVIVDDDDIAIMWKAKIDMRADNSQGIFVYDHKTMKQKRDTLSLNNQFMGQCVLSDSRAVIINKVGWQQSMKPVDKFTRAVLSYSSGQLLEWLGIVNYYGRYLVSLQEQGYWPPRFTHCDKFRRCIFYDVCNADPSLRDDELKRSFMVSEPWDISDSED